MAPGDTVVTVRSLPRRYAALLRSPDDDRPDDTVHRRPGGRPSALDLTAGVTAFLAAIAAAAGAALIHANPEAAVPAGITPAAVAGDETVDSVLSGLGSAAEALASRLDRVASGDWTRPAQADGEPITVLGLARRAAHLGAHTLREVEATVTEARHTR